MFKTQVIAARSAAVVSTVTILCGLILTSLVLPSDHAVGVFATAAIGVGLSLSIATGIEAKVGIRNLIRVDILILWLLYALTFLEFLFPQWGVDDLVLPAAAVSGTNAVLLGFAGLAVGRHLVPMRRGGSQISATTDLRPGNMFLLFVLATLLGYLHVFVSVNFDPLEVLRQMSLPRFSQSWSRGRYGDASALLTEMGALLYLIPPIAGVVYARPHNYTGIQKFVVTIIVLFTFYFGFASGTRSIIVTYVITFFGAYSLSKPDLKLRHVLTQGVPIFILLMFGITYMLAFRGAGGLDEFSFSESGVETLYIDRNMVIISRLTEIFPNLNEFLGFEIPFYGLIHPIPRVLWPGKPEGLSFSVEAELGANPGTVTFACTFVGEAYISGGLLAVLFAGLVFGAMAEIWNRVNRDFDSQFAQLLYASGFFCAALTMRSMMWMSVAALPTLALWLYGRLWLERPAFRQSAVGPN
jgi:oligosaccharide repeat unit polymerase